MSLFLELLFECVGSALLEGAYESIYIKKIPRWIRIMMILLLGLVYGGLAFFFIILGIALLLKGNIAGVLVIAIVPLGIFFTYRGIKKDIEKRKRHS